MMYESTIMAMGVMAGLMLLQLLIADAVGIKAKHSPGSAVVANHDDFLFRATRTVANTNESIAIFLLASLFCILAHANPAYTATAAWGFVVARAVYAACYYFDFRLLRSVIFGLSLLFLAALLVIGVGASGF